MDSGVFFDGYFSFEEVGGGGLLELLGEEDDALFPVGERGARAGGEGAALVGERDVEPED